MLALGRRDGYDDRFKEYRTVSIGSRRLQALLPRVVEFQGNRILRHRERVGEVIALRMDRRKSWNRHGEPTLVLGGKEYAVRSHVGHQLESSRATPGAPASSVVISGADTRRFPR